MTITGLKTNIQALLDGMTDPNFVNVIAHPQDDESQFSGFPSVTHFYSNTISDYATVSQNRRVHQWSIYIYIVTPEDQGDIYTRAYDIVDRVVQMFDESIDLADSDLSLAKACDILRPVPGELGKFSTEQGEGLIAEINLYCEADVAFR